MLNTYAWYMDKDELASPDLIHQILAYGTLDDIREIKKKLGLLKLRELFLKFPKKVYNRPGVNFIKKYILKIDSNIDENRYLKDTPRNIG